ncbi:MAG: hypothetical protein MJ204_00930 [Bacteroidales bacterium]|nr:hypothetical protein [Bacteroidales bacterium]
MAKIELTDKQFQDLLQLLYMGEWVLQAYEPAPNANDVDALEQNLYESAYRQGNDDIEFDKKLGGYVPCEEFEEDCDAIIEKYDEHTFWEELIIRMANRDLAAMGADQLPPREFEKKQNELIKKYEKEFAMNGINNLILKK